MIKTLSNLLQQDKEKYRVPRRVQDVIPIRRIWSDGIFLVGNKYSKMYRFTDINYLVASRADKESMHKLYFKLDHFTGCRFGLFCYAAEETGGSACFRLRWNDVPVAVE